MSPSFVTGQHEPGLGWKVHRVVGNFDHADDRVAEVLDPGADVPNKRCVRVREGGQALQRIDLDRGCFACALGGPNGTTLFMLAQEWNGPENMFKGPRSGLVLTTEAPAPGADWP
jgi:hypothetical protein